jgi:hypothetical protein
MLLTTQLNHTYLRQNYLRGIDLGAGFQGSSADQAMDTMLITLREIAQGQIGVRFCIERVLTYPDPGKVLGTDYEIQGEPLPSYAPGLGDPAVSIVLPFSNVRSIERLRLYDGPTLQETIPLDQTLLQHASGILQLFGPWGSPWLGGLNMSRWAGSPGGWLGGIADAYVRRDQLGVWAVDYTVGLGRIPYDVAAWISLSAASWVLSIAGAGMSLSHGLESESLSQDGIEERLSYARGKYGPYSGTILALMAQRDTFDLVSLRRRYQGLKYPVY